MDGKKTRSRADRAAFPLCDPGKNQIQPFMPRIDTAEILGRIIAEDLRSGRLTARRWRAISRYAEDFGFSEAQTDRLIHQCRNEALASSDPVERYYGRRLSMPMRSMALSAVRFAILAACLIALEIVLLDYFSG